MKRILVGVFVVIVIMQNAASQSTVNRAQTISNIFQIPIQTLTAISNFVQNTRPLGEVIQRRRNPRPVQGIQGSTVPSRNYQTYSNYYRSRAAQIAGLYTASDGSGFKI